MTKAKKAFINKMWICLDKVYTVSPPSLFSFPSSDLVCKRQRWECGWRWSKHRGSNGVWRDTSSWKNRGLQHGSLFFSYLFMFSQPPWVQKEVRREKSKISKGSGNLSSSSSQDNHEGDSVLLIETLYDVRSHGKGS